MNENVTTKCKIGEVRLSYVHIFQPEATTEGGEKKYSVSLIIPKTNKALLDNIKVAIEAAKQAGIAKFGGKIPVNLKTPLRDGDQERPDDDAYAGCWFINASSKTKPGIVKRMKINGENKLVEVTNEEDVYSGCYGFASVNFFAFNTSGNKGIAAGLNNVLKTRDGEYLGGRASAENDFGDVNLDTYEDLGDDFPD
jgi:hypothetical protein